MMNISKDLSGKIDRHIIDAIGDIDVAAKELNMQFFLVGATARDVFFSALHDVKTTRASYDVDIAVRVTGWDEVDQLTSKLLENAMFSRAGNIPHRFSYSDSISVDIVPFGPIENPAGSVSWPQQEGNIMSTTGFQEAFDHSVAVQLKPGVEVAVCTPPAMAALKLVVWHEKYPQRNKDAKDILFLMKEYINAGNQARIYDEHRDLAEIDYELASSRLLGRDIAKIVSPGTRKMLLEILGEETKDESHFRLITEMLRGSIENDRQVKPTLDILKQLMLGIQENDTKP